MAKIKPLRSSPIFSDLSDRELALYSKIVREERYEADTVLVAERMRSDAFYFIDTGKVGIFLGQTLSEAEPLALGPGETFGEWALLVPGHLTVTSARVLEPSDLLVVHSADFEGFCREEPAIALKVVRILIGRAWQSIGDVKDLLVEGL